MPTESGKPLIVISYAHADEPEHPAEGEVKWRAIVRWRSCLTRFTVRCLTPVPRRSGQ